MAESWLHQVSHLVVDKELTVFGLSACLQLFSQMNLLEVYSQGWHFSVDGK